VPALDTSKSGDDSRTATAIVQITATLTMQNEIRARRSTLLQRFVVSLLVGERLEPGRRATQTVLASGRDELGNLSGSW